MKFTDFVEIEDNMSGFEPNDLISVCKRENNSKRDFLFVNKYQGKHVPARPKDIFQLFENLRVTITNDSRWNKEENVCIIGFAETATAIGQYIAENIPNKEHYFLKTTREKLDESLLLDFKEEHSHATEQLLYGDLQRLKKCDRILFVDDEISTGKTILNFINELDKIKDFKYSVASFLNLQSNEYVQIFEEKNIDTYALIRGKIKDISKKIDISPLSAIEDLTVIANGEEQIENLVIGTEEDMYYGIKKAEKIEKGSGRPTYFQASTRSPICVCEDKDYILFNKINFPSAKEKNRKVFLYNLKPYNRIIIMANQSEEMRKNSLFSTTVFQKLNPLTKQIFILPYTREEGGR